MRGGIRVRTETEMDLFLLILAGPEGLEPPACWFEASRSIQLSYGPASMNRLPH